MKKLLIPLILLVVGVGGGVGAGLALSPPPEEEHAVCACDNAEALTPPQEEDAEAVAEDVVEDTTSGREYAKLSNQFVVPVVRNDRVSAMVVMSISVEVLTGQKETIFLAEPKIRDGFLQVMFDHANIGGFSGNFTSANNMRILREELLRSARSSIGDRITDVLIVDIVRQDI